MTPNKRRFILAVAVTALIFAVLSLTSWDFMRDTIVVPIYYLFWIGDLILKSIPQGVYLVGLILLSIALGSSALRGVQVGPTVRKRPQNPSTASARYGFWRRLHTHLVKNRFSREPFSWEARKLILSILAYQEGMDIPQVEAMIVNGALHVPDAVKDVILRRTMRDSKPIPGAIERARLRLRQLFFRTDLPTDPQIEQQVEEIVGFIEHRLEITHAGSQRESRI